MNKKEKIIYSLTIAIFFALALLVALKHELWSDEAHSWLIARDTSFYTLFFKYLHTDGHPALWHLILKAYQFFGGTYEHVFVLPLAFSTIGVSVFLFKSKFPMFIKLMLPFTYFIFYQYTILARGYCLVFLLVCLLAIFWEKRQKNCYLFSLVLILLISSEAYTYVFAGAIYLFYLYEFIRDFKKLDNKKEYGISLFIVLMFFIVTLLYVRPIPTNTFTTHFTDYSISDSFVTSRRLSFNIKLYISAFLIIAMLIFYLEKKKYKEMIFTGLVLFPVWIFYTFFYYNTWHLGIMLFFVLFIIWVQKLENDLPVKVFIAIVAVIQIYWNISSCVYDYNNKYSSGKDVANFIKEYDYNNLTIYGSSFGDSAVNPYFEKNIFDNWDEPIGFFYWNSSNKYYENDFDEQFIMNTCPDIIVTSDFYCCLDYEILSSKYNEYVFKSHTYTEDFIYEDMTLRVYVKKDIDSIHNIGGI